MKPIYFQPKANCEIERCKRKANFFAIIPKIVAHYNIYEKCAVREVEVFSPKEKKKFEMFNVNQRTAF